MEFLDLGHASSILAMRVLKDSSGCFWIEKKLYQALKRDPGHY
jgi:hypothetical protein